MSDDISTLFALGLGPWVTPLRGKVPVLDAWQKLPAVTEPQVRDWIESGYNLGLRTGSRSGVIVIDDDQPRNGGGAYVPPTTGLVVDTPTGGRHYYYRAPAKCPGNSASTLAPKVDVRGEGGQVVVPPSIHPTARTQYRFASTGTPGPWPDTVAHAKPTSTAPVPKANGYADTALVREVHRVRNATEGSRNDTLNKAAYNLGQLVAGGALLQGRAHDELVSAAVLAGLPEREAVATVASGLKAGARSPRGVPERAAATVPRAAETKSILVPGPHLLEGGEYVEQGSNVFAATVLGAIDPDRLYRRAAVLGEIHDDAFIPTPTHRMRSIVDASVRLYQSRKNPDPDGEPIQTYRPCSYDLASLVSEYGQLHGTIRDLKHLASHPVCVGADFQTARPGWNPDSRVYLTVPSVPAALDLPTSKAVLDDLIADFPFQAESDRENFLGLMLTPILRPAIDEPVPMHLIGSPMERTGKTKLAEIVLGVAITGRRTPAMQLGDREEEREKRILAVLMRGQGLLHLDNLADSLDSPSLASLLTSSEYQGRILGSSSSPTIPNGLTVVGTGNNVHASSEIAKRIVPIRLMPSTDAPEARTDFRHPDLLGYVSTERHRVLGALLGLVEHWRMSGRPTYGAGFGGFERWTAVVGGILGAAGYTQWLANRREWMGTVDDSTQEHTEFVTVWERRFPIGAWIEAGKLYELAVELSLFGWLERSKTEHGKRISFGQRVLNRLAGRVVGQHRVEVDGVGSKRCARLTSL